MFSGLRCRCDCATQSCPVIFAIRGRNAGLTLGSGVGPGAAFVASVTILAYQLSCGAQPTCVKELYDILIARGYGMSVTSAIAFQKADTQQSRKHKSSLVIREIAPDCMRGHSILRRKGPSLRYNAHKACVRILTSKVTISRKAFSSAIRNIATARALARLAGSSKTHDGYISSRGLV